MKAADDFKLFRMNRGLLQAELRALGSELNHEIVAEQQAPRDRDSTFYPQFPAALRSAASDMAEHYEIFFCLENFIRELVAERLEEAYGADWWDVSDPTEVVPAQVKENAKRNVEREYDAAVSTRSTEMIDYTTFGELSVIIDSNWDILGDSFNSRKGTTSVLARLNLLRGPIAHCGELSPDEVVRLRLTLGDWFRLMS